MAIWTSVDLIAASALAMALFGALLLGAIISRAREDILGSPIGWRLVAAALSLFALRGLLHFVPAASIDPAQHLLGVLAALVLPLGLFLVLRAGPGKEVGPDG